MMWGSIKMMKTFLPRSSQAAVVHAVMVRAVSARGFRAAPVAFDTFQVRSKTFIR